MTYYHNLGLFFIDVAQRHAENTALRYIEQQFTYADLDHWSERLSTFLLAQKIQSGDVIAIGHSKFFLSYALMIACLRLGITYVNLDVNAPLARNLQIIKVSKPKLIFSDNPLSMKAMQDLAMTSGCKNVALDFTMLPLVTDNDRELQKQLMAKVDGSTIAYVMFTSGSTGVPKGVAITHQNVLHFIDWGQKCFHISPDDNFANLSPMYFDNSVFDFYVGLFSGASLTPIHRELLTRPYELVAFIEQAQCTIWFSVPSLLIYLMTMKALPPQSMQYLRCIIFGGEGYPKAELKKLYEIFASRASIVNVYGPTECTCICSAYFITESDFNDLNGLPPLGKLNKNFDYKILDEDEQEVTKGELCLIGPNVGAGYFNDMARTHASFNFISDSHRFMKPMYRTGDIVEEIDGLLYFVGRKDNQIKHMGYRIELEEIEQALAKLAHVNQAAVIYQRTHSSFGKIIAFVAADELLEEQNVLKQLTELLPDYMLPNRIFIKNILPKNANGKVDRRQLVEQMI
ncbi:MAG: AMP-binding protein [Legionella sp.]|nr:AMP-binding protein [Legionella sp.]